MMKTTDTHTPTPWYAANWTCHAPRTVLVDDASTLTGKRVIAECDRDEDAAFVVRACNSYEQLVAALRTIKTQGIGPDWTAEQAAEFMKQHAAEALAALAAAGAA
jgi:hypothetical protein